MSDVIARRFAAALAAEAQCRWDGCHNSITRQEAGWIHRKGAQSAQLDEPGIDGIVLGKDTFGTTEIVNARRITEKFLGHHSLRSFASAI